MKRRCALLRRWLPGYLDGDLSGFWRRRLRAHLEACPACRHELEALGEVVTAVKAAPVTDPGQDFWEGFSRELHLKLAQANVPAPVPRRSRIPYYLLGAPALAVLLLWAATHLTDLRRPVLPQMAQTVAPEQLVYVALDEDGAWQDEEEDYSNWDLEPVIADLTEKERTVLLKKLRLKEKDGSCGALSSSVSWS